MFVVTMTDGRKYATRALPGDSGTPDAFAQGPDWTDATTPRTDKPLSFIPRARGRARARIIRQGWDPNSFTIRL